jgi:hypothetical protein
VGFGYDTTADATPEERSFMKPGGGDGARTPTLLVMAAGVGSRFGGDKQLEPVGPAGETLLDYSVFDALRAGFTRVVFVIRHDMEERFRAAVGRRYEDRAEVAYALQELHDVPGGFSVPADRTKPWGTGHAVLAAAGLVTAPFAVINADDYYGADSFAALGRFLAAEDRAAHPGVFALVAFRLRETLSEHGSVARGVCVVGADGALLQVKEVRGIERAADRGLRAPDPGGERRFTGDEPVSLNLWGFTPALFPLLREKFTGFLSDQGRDPGAEFFLPEAVNALMHEGRVRVEVLRTRSRWFGLTYRADQPRVARALREMAARGEYPWRLWG